MSHSTLSNISWKFAERVSMQLISLIVSIVIARILNPTDFAPIAIVLSVTNLAYAIVDGGFSSALIQKKDADILDFSTIFHFTIVFSIVIYGIVYFLAPFIHRFFGSQYTQLTSILRTIGLLIPIYGLNSIQQAYVSRKMMFHTMFYSSAIGTIISAFMGVFMAINGYGVWSLVAQIMSLSIISSLSLFAIIRKLPKWQFSIHRFISLIKYGSRILGATLLINIFEELRTFVIGKLYTPSQLAYFDRGRQFPLLIVNNVSLSLSAVLFPKLSQYQDNIVELKNLTRRSIRMSAYLMTPLVVGLIACAEPLVRLLLTEKWLFCVPFLRIFCIFYLFQPIHSSNMQAIKAIGRSDVFLKLEIFKKTIEVICLLCVMRISVYAIAINMAILTTIFTFVNAYPNKKFLNYTFLEQMKDIYPQMLLAIIMGGIIYPISMLSIHDGWILSLQVLVGFIVYITLSLITKNKEFKEISMLISKVFS